jgi:outer membrane lipoprotein LolB
MRTVSAAGFFALFLLLGGCASTATAPSVAQQQSWSEHRQALEALSHWQFSARIAGRSDDDGWSGKLNWQQRGDHYFIHFQAPFGQGAAQLRGERGRVELRTGNGQVFVAEDAELLLSQRLGWRLPVAGLQYWLRGLPAPLLSGQAEPVMRLSTAGRLRELQQSQWKIHYAGYQIVDGQHLPKKMDLENAHFSLRLVLDRWQLKSVSVQGQP